LNCPMCKQRLQTMFAVQSAPSFTMPNIFNHKSLEQLIINVVIGILIMVLFGRFTK
jgi:hypothetical protein